MKGEGFYGEFLKLRIQEVDCYFPTRGLDSLKSWLWSFACFRYSTMDSCFNRAGSLVQCPIKGVSPGGMVALRKNWEPKKRKPPCRTNTRSNARGFLAELNG